MCWFTHGSRFDLAHDVVDGSPRASAMGKLAGSLLNLLDDSFPALFC